MTSRSDKTCAAIARVSATHSKITDSRLLVRAETPTNVSATVESERDRSASVLLAVGENGFVPAEAGYTVAALVRFANSLVDALAHRMDDLEVTGILGGEAVYIYSRRLPTEALHLIS